jgi:hypothetical protein
LVGYGFTKNSLLMGVLWRTLSNAHGVAEIHVPDVPNFADSQGGEFGDCSTSPARQCGLSVPNLPTATAENLAYNSASWAKQCDRTRSPVGVSRKRDY